MPVVRGQTHFVHIFVCSSLSSCMMKFYNFLSIYLLNVLQPNDPPFAGSGPFANLKPNERRKQRSSHEPPKTGFQPGKIYFRKATRSFYLCCASSVYCFRVDKNGWLEHLYWGPWIDSKDDMTYLQYANVNLPFDPKVSSMN